MIKLVCDNCEKEFEVDANQPDGKVACPYCGDVNRLPVATAQPAARAAAPAVAPAARAAAPAMAPAAQEPEKELVLVRAAMFRVHPFLYTLMVLLFLGGIVLAILARPGN